MKKRIYWIDNLKGFILILVCMSHLKLIPEDCDYLRGGRMTTFFFLSGLLFNTRKYPTFSLFWKSKCHSLLIPYFILSCLFALFPFSMEKEIIYANQWIYFFNLPPNIEKYINTYILSIVDIIQGYSFIQSTFPLWFVYTLFQVSIVYYLINKVSHKYLRLILILLCLHIGWLCNMYKIILPFHLNTMFTSLFFFGLGHYCQIYLEKGIKIPFPYIVLFLLIYTLTYLKGGFVGLLNNNLGTSFITFILYSISGIFLFITIFRYLSHKDNVIWGIFRNISRNAIIILCVHSFYGRLFDELFDGYYIYKLLFVFICTIISIPIFRCYLYKLIGKEKITIRESLSIK